ncbi:MAG TPA: DUF6491 family protein [Novosphingobium sp.]|nr:DUF6491 family protein [Novosphingobium sp.]
MIKKLSVLLVPMSLLAAMPAAAIAGPSPTARSEASIPFANHGGVNDWRAEGDRTIYFQDQHRRWYRATLMAPAFDLPFVERIGIDSGPMGTLDKFGAVIVKGQRYPFASFEQVAGPPSKASKKAHRIDAPASAGQH